LLQSRPFPSAEVAIPDRITLLADVAEIVSRSHDLEETLANVIDHVAKRLDADVCSIYLSGPDLRRLTLRATRGLDSRSVRHVTLDFGEGLVGLAAERGEVVGTDHASRDPNYRYFPETGEEKFESLLAAPMIVQGVTIGVLVIQTVGSRHFDSTDIGLLQTCAQLLAPVVTNAQLLALAGDTEAHRAAGVSELVDQGIMQPGPPHRSELNVELEGIPTSRGIAIGPIYRIENPVDLEHLEYSPSEDPAQEKHDLREALAEARREIEGMREVVGERFGPEFEAVFHTQIQILEDHGFVAKLEQGMEESGDALVTLREVLDAYKSTFERIEDPYFRERGADVGDVGKRVMEKLLGVRRHIQPMEPGSVVVVDQVYPELFATLEMDAVAGIVSEHGGETSHGAIFARTLEIPAVTGVASVQQEARAGETAIVDGGSGKIYLSPDEALTAEYRRAQQEYADSVQHLDAMRERPAETRDGREIVLSANVGLLNDLRLIDQHGAQGVGLFRTELLALAHRGFPSEEEQDQLYRRVVETMGPRSVTIRTLDLGGDKGIPNIGLDDEENPQLGCRSIRLTLENQRAFQAQLRAILRASANRSVRLLFPMISGIGELREARRIVEDVKEQLVKAGADFDPDIPVGVMIEVPSAAICADVLASECDFFSIGTNDLTQYTLAVDRGNERVAHLYNPLHPAVLALIARSVEAAQRADIPVSVCGEMAMNPLAVPMLVGLGVGELSGTPSQVPLVKEIVRAVDSGEVNKDARRALAAGSVEEVRAIGAERLRDAGLLDHPDVGGWLRGIVDPILGVTS
jgi:phosphotransferase system enzyme I (PtsP)